MMRTGLVTIVCLAMVGCGGAGAMQIVSSRDLDGAGGAPSVSRVTDLGTLALIPQEGRSLGAADSDGVFAIGELVLIEGDDFGKLPAVNIGGRPTEPLARTGNGGIIARIPAGIATGGAEVEVSHPRGRGARSIEVVRFAVVVEPAAGKLHVIQIDSKGVPTSRGSIDVPGARDVAISHDGAAAYVVANATGAHTSARLEVIALTATGGPKLARTVRLMGDTAEVVVTAARAPVGAVLGGGRVTVIDTGNALSPGTYDAAPVAGLGAVTAAAMHPEGGLLVVMSAQGNTLLPIDLGNRAAVRAGAPVSAMPGESLPMVRDLGFSPMGDELWVVAGDNAGSLVGGQHETSIIQLRVAGSEITLDDARVMAGADAPIALAVARREAIGSATAIRSTARKAAIVCATVDRTALPGLTGGSLAEALPQSQPFGQLVRTDLEGRTEPLWKGEAAAVGIELSPDARHVLAALAMVTRSGGAVTHRLALAVTGLGGGKATLLELGAPSSAPILSRAPVAIAP